MARARRSKTPEKGGGNKVLTLTGSRQYSMVGYAHNPIRQYEQVVVNNDVGEHLLEQRTLNPRTKQHVEVFQEGVVKRPVRVRKTEVDHHKELRTKRRKGKNLDPNAALDDDDKPNPVKTDDDVDKDNK